MTEEELFLSKQVNQPISQRNHSDNEVGSIFLLYLSTQRKF